MRKVLMKRLLIVILAVSIIPISVAQISLNVYEHDEITPLGRRDIMVGSKVALIVTSDANDYWSGGLFIRGQDRALATLYGRDSDPNIRDYTRSHYPAAGDMARVTAWKDSFIWGFDLYGSDIDLWDPNLYGSDLDATAGDWFIIDYKAIGMGDPNVGFYDYSINWNDPVSVMTFHHVPTRDFNMDEIVDLSDYGTLACHWLDENCSEPNWCGGTDISRDGWVDMVDLALFEKYWLWGVPPVEELNIIPDVTYSIVDANGLSEITMAVNESITLYLSMDAMEPNTINAFNVEVNISDPNLGSIDNRAYDFDNPPGPGTARILAQPRNEGFDYWGPGTYQPEGIELFGASIGEPMSDGLIASFEYTCNGGGDVALDLIDWNSSGTTELEGILIHQVDPYSQQMMSGGMGAPEASQLLEPVENTDVDELVRWLEQLWLDDEEVRETYSEDDWNEFVDSVRNSY